MSSRTTDGFWKRLRHGWSEEATVVLGSAAFATWFSCSQVLAWGADLEPLLVRSLLQWTAGALLALPVLRLIRRFPIARPYRVQRAALYALLGLPVEVAHQLVAIRAAVVEVLGLPVPSLRYMLISAATVDQITYWSFVIVMHVLLFRRRTQESAVRVSGLEAELAESRLLDLRERLQPDFLVSALRTAGALLYGDASAARRALARLGDFLRITQKHIGERTIPVHEEATLLAAVVDLRRPDLGDRIQSTIEVDGTSQALHVAHPQMQSLAQRVLAEVEPESIVRFTFRAPSGATTASLEAEIIGLGEPQAEALGQRLRALGPGVQCEPHAEGGLHARLLVPLELGPPPASSAPGDDLPGLGDDVRPLVNRPPRLRRWFRSGAWPLIGLWAALSAWMAFSAYALFPEDITLTNVSGMLVDRTVWGVLGLPLVRAIVRRSPLRLSRVPGYLILGLILSVACGCVTWWLEGPANDLRTWLLDAGGLWSYWTLVALAHLVLFARRDDAARLRESALRGQIAEARLRALEMQLRPHFLLNALHSVAALIGRDPAAAAKMLSRVENFLRRSLEGNAAAMVPLREELAFLRQYLEIQQVRFQDRLTTEFEVGDDAAAGLVPSLILQPIVENAIRHGIAPRASGGHIRVTAAHDRGRLIMVVEDDGLGTAGAFDESRFGLGLTNTQARLRLLYGKDHRLLVHGGGPGRFTVSLDVPFRAAS